MRRFLAVLLICVLLIPPVTASGTEYTNQNNFALIEEMLQGTWEYRGKDSNSDVVSCHIFEFYKGTLYYKSYFEGYENSIHSSWGTYLVKEGGIDNIYENYTSHLKYELKGDNLVLSWYVESGADKGMTYYYTKTSEQTPDIPSSINSEDKNSADSSPSGEWTIYDEFALRSCKKLMSMGVKTDSYAIDKVFVLQDESTGYTYTFIEGSDLVSEQKTTDIFVYNDFFLQREPDFEPNYVGERTEFRKTLYDNMTTESIRLHFTEFQADYMYITYSDDVSKGITSSSLDVYEYIPIQESEILSRLSMEQPAEPTPSVQVKLGNIMVNAPDGKQSIDADDSSLTVTIREGDVEIHILSVDLSNERSGQIMLALLDFVLKGTLNDAAKEDPTVKPEFVEHMVLNSAVEFEEYNAAGTHWSTGKIQNGDMVYGIIYSSKDYSESAAEVYERFLSGIVDLSD